METVVIGGSQAGLAVGYHLQRHGLPFVIVDENGRVGDAWRNRWDSLRLFTPARYDGLPGMPFPGSSSAYPSKDEVADYLEALTTQPPRRLFRTRTKSLEVQGTARTYAIDMDGRRFLVANATDEAEYASISIVKNWRSSPAR